MRPETRRKLDRVKSLLKRGYSLSKAIREVRVGWKTYHKYEDYILSDPEVPRPKRKLHVHVGPLKFDRTIDVILRQVSRYVAKKLITKKYGTVYIEDKRREVGKLAKYLRKVWLEEIAKSILRI